MEYFIIRGEVYFNIYTIGLSEYRTGIMASAFFW